MSLELLKTVKIIELMENYIEGIRPLHHSRHELDIKYEIDNQSIILFEVRPSFREATESPYAKATYIKISGKWKIYWMRGNLKWTLRDISRIVHPEKFYKSS